MYTFNCTSFPRSKTLIWNTNQLFLLTMESLLTSMIQWNSFFQWPLSFVHSANALQIFQHTFLTTLKVSEINFAVDMQHLESVRFYLCLHKFAELWNLFSRVHMGNCFWCYFSQSFTFLAFRKCKNHCNILNIILRTRFMSTENWNCSIFYRISS